MRLGLRRIVGLPRLALRTLTAVGLGRSLAGRLRFLRL